MQRGDRTRKTENSFSPYSQFDRPCDESINRLFYFNSVLWLTAAKNLTCRIKQLTFVTVLITNHKSIQRPTQVFSAQKTI